MPLSAFTHLESGTMPLSINHHRWVDCKPDAYALYHAGGLSLSRPLPPLVGAIA